MRVRATLTAMGLLLAVSCAHSPPTAPDLLEVPEVVAIPVEPILYLDTELFRGPEVALTTLLRRVAHTRPKLIAIEDRSALLYLLPAASTHRLASNLRVDRSLDLVATPRIMTTMDQSTSVSVAVPRPFESPLSLCFRGESATTRGDALRLALSLSNLLDTELSIAPEHTVAILIPAPYTTAAEEALLIHLRASVD